MSHHPARDALEVGLALALIFSFLYCALAHIWLADKADEGRRWKRAMDAAVPLPPKPDPKDRLPPAAPPTERGTLRR